MASIVIRLDPGLMKNADADLRYEIPRSLEESSSGHIKDCGYSYEADTDAMHIYLDVDDLQTALPIVVAMMDNNEDLKMAARIGMSEQSFFDTKTYAIVFPTGVTGTIESLG